MSDIDLVNFIDLLKDEKNMILDWRNNQNIRKWMYTKDEIILENHLKFIDSLKNSEDKFYFLVKKDNEYIGVIYFINITKYEVYFGLYANPMSNIAGIGRILEQTSINFAFNTLKVEKLKLEVFEDNIQVRNLHKKYKFKEVGEKLVNDKKVICMELKNIQKKDILKSFKNKKIYIAPHSPITLSLEHYLKEQNISSNGFIDKNKKDINITQIEKISNEEYDYIFILSPNHFEAIAQEYLNYIPKEKIIKVDIENAKYILSSSFSNTKREFLYIPKDMEFDRKKVVFISKGFISANNKALYLYCIKNKIDTTILTDNKNQIEELKQNRLPYQILETKEADYEIAIAKYIIFDQGNYTYLPELHISQKTIQLWHGVGLKKMSKMSNITYDYFISTSNWTNETNFKNIFQAKSFLNLGYARNDIFFRQEDYLDLIFCDRIIYETVKNSKKRVILYMPTHRENRSSLKLYFEKLNKNLQEIDALFIVKIHPMVLEYYKTTQNKEYSNIFFHNGYGDIYPLLKYVDVLVSDYSSIVYDFLLLNKPIIFYIYDIDEYIKNVQLLFDYDEFSPGAKVKTQDELENAFLKEDNYRQKREAIRNLFFDKIAQNISSTNIIDTLIKGK